MRPCGDPKTLELRRLEAINLLNKGIGPGEIARRLNVDRRSAQRWLAAYRDQGFDGIAPLPVPGRPCKLSLEDREILTRMLLKGATNFGYPTNLWTSSRVADLIRQRFQVVYHVNHISRLLCSCDFFHQKHSSRSQENIRSIRGWIRVE